ncbi:MAG: DUF2905 family protein [Cyanobium sp.]
MQRPGFSFSFPLTTSLLLSAILSMVFWQARQLRGAADLQPWQPIRLQVVSIAWG